MELHCFGTTGYHPSPSRHTACYYLPDQGILLDAGTGVFRLIQHLREYPRDTIDVFLTHAHLDHVVGLTFLLDAIAVTSLSKIRLHGEASKLAAVNDHLYSELLFPVPNEFELCPFESDNGSRSVGETMLRWFPLEHPGGSLGYIIESEGRKLAYITDTVARDNSKYRQYINGCDLLMHECYFDDAHSELAQKTGHSWLSAVVDVVRQAQAKRTLLIHVNPLAEILGDEIDIPESLSTELNLSFAVDEQVLLV